MFNNSEIRGSCNAIFSSSPINFNKENESPLKARTGNTSETDLAKKTPRMDKISQLNKNKSISVETVVLNKNESLPPERVNSSPSLSFRRAKITNRSQRQDSKFCKKSYSDDKLKTPSKSKSINHVPTEKSPVRHFCSSKSSSNISNIKTDGTPFRTPVKRFFDSHLMSSTPDCFGSVQFETPRVEKTDVTKDEATIYDEENSNLTVGIRVRPMNSRELNDQKVLSIIKVKDSSIIVECDSSQHEFIYDHCFVSYSNTERKNHASQETVFNNMVLPLVQNAFEGYNVCLFAYGQTGSGKSYSMMGSESSFLNSTTLCEDAGIIPRFCHEIFTRAAENKQFNTSVEISYFEIYNEKIHDLLTTNSNQSGTKRAPLKVREHPIFGPYVVDLSQHTVQNYEDLQMWLKVGNSQRATAATGMNEKSSRSHSIFSIILTQGQNNDPADGVVRSGDSGRRSKINLVDLAGSERLSQTCASGERLREGVSINKSLLILGKVIASLAESTTNRKRGFVPYRESVLTWLLKESLGGNSKTAMLATVSPSSVHLEETLATLRYACQARSIVNRVRVNEDAHDKLIRELKAEVLRLKSYGRQLASSRLLSNEGFGNLDEEVVKKQVEIDQLKDQLKKTEEQLAINQKSFAERLQEAGERRKSELNFLRHCGIAVEIDLKEKNSTPCLVNLAADPMLSGTLLYLIPPGKVRIGRTKHHKAVDTIDIILNDPLVAPFHCTVENNNGVLSLTPESNGDTYVNGQLICDRVYLKHGDRLIIGGNHYFKVCNPHDERFNSPGNNQLIDYEFAHQEILSIQEEKLKAELEEAKQKALMELENAKKEVEIQLTSQKSVYENEIKLLGVSLEQHKAALREINQKKRELEIEKEILTYQIEKNDKQDVNCCETISISPYESNFLEELKKLLTETTNDVETALVVEASNEAIVSAGITMHEMQLLVKEATERCREIGINYEFFQQKLISDKGLEPIIKIRDKDRMLETLWQPRLFLNWLHKLRDFDDEDTIKELIESETPWEAFEESEIPEYTFNSSRISINLTPVKKQLNESLHQLSMNSSLLDVTQDKTSEVFINKRHDDMNACLLQMELATNTLKKLCHQYESRELSGEVTKSLDNVCKIVSSLRNKLDLAHKNDQSSTKNSTNMESSLNNVDKENISTTETQKIDQNNLENEPKKLKKEISRITSRKCPFFQDNSQKSVRFNVE
ncbi:kinesin-like protein KIF14 isoform X1 [Chelonus insularis]|uniref:kinesin-like protein KIF14 isoform X1 n=1 Tax=Chelonus insularis TaxID=460826 RepID=UPI00158BAD08|nr:kinesin-like protein KIF14 isoform X1 [Chelonus insularis]